MRDFTGNWHLVALALALAASAIAAPLASASVGTGPLPAKPVTLYGSSVTPNGWGYGPNNITNPGPTITVDQGDVINFNLFAHDGQPHTLVIDLNSNGIQDTGEPVSAQFSSATTATTFQYTASTAGTIQYYCGLHGATVMRGTLTVRSTGGTPAASDNTVLIIGGVVILVAIVAVAAAVMMRRKKPGP